jgi:hypothetical protein
MTPAFRAARQDTAWAIRPADRVLTYCLGFRYADGTGASDAEKEAQFSPIDTGS